jgi:hypothetical protein
MGLRHEACGQRQPERNGEGPGQASRRSDRHGREDLLQEERRHKHAPNATT